MSLLSQQELKKQSRLRILLECAKKAEIDPAIESMIGQLEVFYTLKYEKDTNDATG